MYTRVRVHSHARHDHQNRESHEEGKTAAKSFPGENQSRADRSRLRRGRASSVNVECVGCTVSFSTRVSMRTCVGCTTPAVCGRQR